MNELAGVGSGVVAAGSTLGKPTLTAFGADGAIDSAFPAGGVSPVTFDSTGLVRLADGKFIYAGSEPATNVNRYPDPQVARINADGSLDPTYGAGGTVTLKTHSNYADATGLAVDPAGRAVVSALRDGYYPDGLRAEGRMARWTSRSRATAGWSPTSAKPATTLRSPCAPDGKIVLAGERIKDAKNGFDVRSSELTIARFEVRESDPVTATVGR